MNLSISTELVSEVFEEALRHTNRHSGQHTITVQMDDDLLLAHMDAKLVVQVLINLVDNAIKFSREGGALRIGIKRKTPAVIEVSVYNEGEGIDPEELPYVFERFYKSDKSRGLDKNGVGLGLYIVKTIIEAMKQTICVESEKGQFCEFRFTLKAYVPEMTK